MKRLLLPSTILLFLLCLLPGCGERTESEETAYAPPQYRIVATLDAKGKKLLTETTVQCSVPAAGLSALKFRFYANAYQEGNAVVAEEKYRNAYKSGIPSYGGTEITAVESEIPIVERDFGQGGTILTLRFGRTLAKGEVITLKFSETVTLAEIKHHLGYYNGYYSLAHFYPELCPFSDGKFVTHPPTTYGDPFLHQIADFSLDLTLPRDLVCACSAQEILRENQGTVIRYSYRSEKARDLAFVASSSLHCLEGNAAGIPIRYYYQNATARREILELVTSAIDLFAESFGAYPYPTYTVVSFPFCEAGAEHSGMGVISGDLTVAEQKSTILHETAHQWWFGKVGNDQYSDPWMDEGAAEYAVAYYYKARGSDGAYRLKIRKAEDAYALLLAVKGTSGARFDLPLSEMREDYYDRVYCGGLLLFDTLAEKYGFERFNAALRDYADAFSGRIASPEEMIAALSASLGEDLEGFFRAWLSGNVPVQ